MADFQSWSRKECKNELHNYLENRGSIRCTKNNCNFVYKSLPHLKRHIKEVHDKIVKYECSNCDLKKYESACVRRHQSTSHRNEECRIIRIGCKLCVDNVKHKMHQNENQKNEKNMKSIGLKTISKIKKARTTNQ